MNLGGNGFDFFQADPLAAQYLQPTSPSPGLPIAVNKSNLINNDKLIHLF